jgi:TPR repeat protein
VDVTLLLPQSDPRAYYFAAVLGDSSDEILRAADLGDAMAWYSDGEESFQWAEKSVAQGERDGFFVLGRCYRDGSALGSGCEEDLERAKENFLVASELGHVMRCFLWATCLAKMIRNDLFGLEELLLQNGILFPS